ncbi:unnamed protein product [Adineta ricciae]|uniref:Uncharacterized protein n=1 Tax=Adineta ricciae TaxID=249248 RepID=A0A815LCR8_ADIRI|nr:unnamed protein product [Adineta ricciae]
MIIYPIYMGVILCGPSLALSQITGLSLWMIVGFAGVICTFYTSIGGMKAVIWADVKQTVMMFLGVMLSIVFGFMDAGGIEKVFKTAIQGDRLNLINFYISPFIRYIFWNITCGGGLYFTAAIACLQIQAQRFLCVKDLRSAKKVAWINCFQFIFMLFLTACVGLLLYSKYQSCDPLQAKIISKADQLYPLFVTETLGKIPGLTGIFISCILNASLSSISSGINSIVTVMVEDIYKRIKTSSTISDQQQTIISKVVSYLMSHMGNHVLVIVFQIAGSFAAPILGIYLVGFFLRRVNSRSILIAFFLCLIFQMWTLIGSTLAIKQRVRSDGRLSLSIQECSPPLNITRSTRINENTAEQNFFLPLYSMSFLWYNVNGVVLVVVLSYFVSLTCRVKDSQSVDEQLLISWRNLFICSSERQDDKQVNDPELNESMLSSK